MPNDVSILSEFVNNGEINIDEQTWTTLNEKYSRQELFDALKQEIASGSISLPLKKITLDEAKYDFYNLVKYSCSEYMGCLCTRYDYAFDKIDSGIYFAESNVGNLASNYFQQENRFACDSINAPSPIRTWESDKFINGVLNSLWTLKFKQVNTATLRTCLSLRKYVASQFKPSIAKSVYEKFNSKNVLDFSAGWGDRLCGFYACEGTRQYIGIDPNVQVYLKYFDQVSMYEQYTHKDTRFICLPAEEVELPPECVDTVFTSPPYFNIERYSQDDTQSYKRYKTVDRWLEGFLFKAIDLSINSLQSGGHLLVNISDCYSGHKINHICDPMNEYIKRDKRMSYEGVIGMRMAKRPNSKTISKGRVFVEPIWVWRKK